ncbi:MULTISPECIES: ATP-binding protein [Ignavibacterium]|jgi:PAS domain S-box-containing protein|uniref:ATP-binding protein n=1 Tax=Ignavibacterium TaxID=795750 RepID=UPI0025C52F69|nr:MULTISPECIES: ATP-binding protein [Ignavibacterium]MBI5662823.1 PAS domain S-box protein [Ignavibacterium album]
MDELRKYLEILYNRMIFPVEVIDSTGKIIYVNEAFSLMWGFTSDELVEYSLFNDLVLREQNKIATIREALENLSQKTIEHYEDSLLRSHHSVVPLIRSSVFGFELNAERYAVLVHEDVTEHVLTAEEIKRARDASKEAERLKNNFLNVLSHELRTPLNIILGYSSLIKENLSDKISTEDKIYLDNLHSGSERLFNTINQMLEFAHIEAGNYSITIETTDLVGIIQGSLAQYNEAAKSKGLEIRTNFVHKKIFVDTDVQCTLNAFNNLLNNAVKFTNQGFIEIEVDVMEDKNLAVCRVRDSGIGISTKYLDHLFQPFSQEDLNIGRSYEGNGLGLALAKRYLEKVGGSLLVDSIKGVGSTFTFTLPLTSSSKIKYDDKEEAEILSANKILMLDNIGETYELIRAFLKKDYQIVNFTLRDFKIEQMRDNSFSHIVFDVEKNFWQQAILICKDIKRNDPYKRPIIVISSEFIEEKIREFYNAGANKFLIKPFGKSELVKVLDEAKEYSL